MLYAQVHLTLPAWVHDTVDASRAYRSDTEKVALAIDLSKRNIEANSGGPFGAAVFGPDDRIIAVGVNRVVPHACSVAHAEMMAYMLAQGRTQRLRLNRDADGNALAPGDLALQATATVLPDPPAPLALREIRTGELVDYIGEVRAKAPASVQFRLSATRGGSRAEMTTTADVQPR